MPEPTPVPTMHAATPTPEPTPAPVLSPATATLAQARNGEVAHFENTLGIRFLPVPRTRVLFSVWQVRVQDYRAFAEEMGSEWPKAEFEQGDDHPAVNVNDVGRFCGWLTERERRAGRITAAQGYGLPTDEEWSWAVGLPAESGSTPKEKNGKVKEVYPWKEGKGTWPPPVGAGNYPSSLGVDRFENTSPVGSFATNANGLYDLGGNVWEWCLDEYDPYDRDNPPKDLCVSGDRFDQVDYREVLRGGSWFDGDPTVILSSFRFPRHNSTCWSNVGFRLVLGETGDPQRRLLPGYR